MDYFTILQSDFREIVKKISLNTSILHNTNCDNKHTFAHPTSTFNDKFGADNHHVIIMNILLNPKSQLP